MRLSGKAGIAIALTVAASAMAGIAVSAPYIALRGSLAFAEDPETRISGVPLRTSLDTGWGVSAALGNEFGPVHLEFEGVYRNFGIDRITSGGVAHSAQGHYDVMAPMVNVILDFPLDRYMPSYGVTPYLGAGIGGAYASIQPRATGTPLVDDDSWGFAYQVMAGLSVPLMNNVTMRVGYRYLAAPNMEFRRTGGTFKTDLQVHSVDLGFDLRF